MVTVKEVVDAKARELIKQHNACFPTAQAQAHDLATDYHNQKDYENSGFWALVANRVKHLGSNAHLAELDIELTKCPVCHLKQQAAMNCKSCGASLAL